jgi:hypothetical protein
MAEKQQVFSTLVLTYDSILEFVEALKSSNTKRIFTFGDGGFLGIGASWTASFIDDKGQVHFYQDLNPFEENNEDKDKLICDVVKENGIIEVDGIIRVSTRVDFVYLVFQTDCPDDQEMVAASYNEWMIAVKSLNPDVATIQYCLDKDNHVGYIDAYDHKLHYIIRLDGHEGRCLDDIRNMLTEYEFVDLLNNIAWYLDLVKG